MGIKIISTVAVICCLISVSSATIGNAIFAENFSPGKCKDVSGDYVATVNPQFFSMRGYTCGSGMGVMCHRQAYCKHEKPIHVKIVGECSSTECPGENDMVMSKNAFADLANIEEKKIQVNWNHVL